MTEHHRWILKAADGSPLRSSEDFESRADAEAWLAGHWAAAVDEGADAVALMSGDDVVYEMSLRPAEPH